MLNVGANLTAFIGVLIGHFISNLNNSLKQYATLFVAGFFIYTSSVMMLPKIKS